MIKCAAFATISALLSIPAPGQSVDRLTALNVSIAQTNFKGRGAIQVIAKPDAANATSYASVKDATFRDGVIEVELAGQPASAAFEGRSRVYWHRFSHPE